jgi:hypothetical protein
MKLIMQISETTARNVPSDITRRDATERMLNCWTMRRSERKEESVWIEMCM